MNNPFLARSVSQFRLEQRSLLVGKNFGLAKTLFGNIEIYTFLALLSTEMTYTIEILVVDDRNHFTWHGQYGCWCPDDAGSQGIGSHGIDWTMDD